MRLRKKAVDDSAIDEGYGVNGQLLNLQTVMKDDRLVVNALRGSLEAKHQLIKRYSYLVDAVVWAYRELGLDQDTLIVEGRDALAVCIDSVTLEDRHRFPAYALRSINERLIPKISARVKSLCIPHSDTRMHDQVVQIAKRLVEEGIADHELPFFIGVEISSLIAHRIVDLPSSANDFIEVEGREDTVTMLLAARGFEVYLSTPTRQRALFDRRLSIGE